LLEIGGTCAGGGPFVGERPCPEGVPLAIAGGVLGALVCSWINIRLAIKYSIGSMIILVGWPGLFLSLGYNFVEFGLNPASGDGVVWLWLVCAGVLGLVGAAPLFAGLGAALNRNLGHGVGSPEISGPDASQPGSDDTGTQDDLVSELERLADLRKIGALTEEEFESTKRRLLGDSQP
jgi:hypothetical protein